jgi:phosphinothricin acetyltransferase
MSDGDAGLDPRVLHVTPADASNPAWRDRILDLWVRVTDAGGAVGFAAPADRDAIAAALDVELAAVADGRDDLAVLIGDDDRLLAIGFLRSRGAAICDHWRTVMRLMVDPDEQGRGHGGRLLDALADVARTRGCDHLQLTVRGGQGLESFYRRHGYRQVGVHPGAVLAGDDRLDEVMFVLDLSAGRPPRPLPEGITIRPAIETDHDAVTAIHNALIPTTTYEWRDDPHDPADRAAWFASKAERGHPVLVADDDGTVVGWATYGDFRNSVVRPGYRFTVEHTILIAESHWGTGVAEALLDAIVAAAEADGRRVMVGAIDGENVRSIRFHERHGFTVTGRMPGIGEKFGRRLDLVLVQRELAPA